MILRRCILAVIAASLVLAAAWTVEAQDKRNLERQREQRNDPKNADNSYSSAKDVLRSFNEIAKSGFVDPARPTSAELAAYFKTTFARINDYLGANAEASDLDILYSWASTRMFHGYGNEGFIQLGRRYLESKPKAKDRDAWRLAVIQASLGHNSYRKEAEIELKKLEADCPETDAAMIVRLAWIRMEHASRSGLDAEVKSLTSRLLKHPAVVANKDLSVERMLVRAVMGANTAEVKEGAKFPDWSDLMPIKDKAGNVVKLSDYKGKVVLLDFWAIWSPPSMMELSRTIELHKQYNPKGLEIIGINADHEQNEGSVNAILHGRRKGQSAVSWRQIFDGGNFDNGLWRRYGANPLPWSILIDSQGRVAATGLRGDALEAKVKELLGLADSSERKDPPANPQPVSPDSPREKNPGKTPGNEDSDDQY